MVFCPLNCSHYRHWQICKIISLIQLLIFKLSQRNFQDICSITLWEVVCQQACDCGALHLYSSIVSLNIWLFSQLYSTSQPDGNCFTDCPIKCDCRNENNNCTKTTTSTMSTTSTTSAMTFPITPVHSFSRPIDTIEYYTGVSSEVPILYTDASPSPIDVGRVSNKTNSMIVIFFLFVYIFYFHWFIIFVRN